MRTNKSKLNQKKTYPGRTVKRMVIENRGGAKKRPIKKGRPMRSRPNY